MKKIDQIFFDLITYGLSESATPITLPTILDTWQYLHKIAASQKLWPVVFEVVSDKPEYLNLPQNLQSAWMMETRE